MSQSNSTHYLANNRQHMHTELQLEHLWPSAILYSHFAKTIQGNNFFAAMPKGEQNYLHL